MTLIRRFIAATWRARIEATTAGAMTRCIGGSRIVIAKARGSIMAIAARRPAAPRIIAAVRSAVKIPGGPGGEASRASPHFSRGKRC